MSASFRGRCRTITCLDHTSQRLTTVAAGPVGLAEALALIDRQAADGAWSYTCCTMRASTIS